MKYEIIDAEDQQAVIKVVGVGGGGGNAVNYMMECNIDGVEFISANTDAQAMQAATAPTILQLGRNQTKGLGAGADPDIGRQAAIEDRELIADVLSGSDMVFITAGMGGGTGTGAAPIFAEIAKDVGALTVAVVTRPFRFEKRDKVAELGLQQLKQSVDSLITIPNEKLLEVMGKDASLKDAFSQANNVLASAVQGISELITRPGLINVDFADVRTVMSEMGDAMMGSSSATGANRAEEATRDALSSPLLEEARVSEAKGILVNVTAADLTIGEYSQVGSMIEEMASDNANVVIGTTVDDTIGDELRVTMVATGIEKAKSQSVNKSPQTKPVEVVRQIGKAVGGYESVDDNEDLLFHPRSALSGDLPPASDFDGDEYDIPTILREQHD
ncbi:MAG: cell division protein FtsZ [Arenicella sp.]